MEIQTLTMAFFKSIPKHKSKVTISFSCTKQIILFSDQQVGYGIKRMMICPICGKTKTKLYLENKLFRCGDCCSANLYRGIQNTTQGGDAYIAYKMERYAIRNGIGVFEYPFDYTKHPKPKGKHQKKWERNLKVMQALESMRFQSIFSKKIWDSKTIRSIEREKNQYLQYNLEDLKKYLYPFDSGV